MTLKLYLDLISQPCRALYILLKTVQYPFEFKPVDLVNGAHRTEEFTKINRFQLVPVMEHNGFILTESVAILKYLAREGILSDSVYPKENQLQARVDEFLEFHHVGLRMHLMLYMRAKVVEPLFMGLESDPRRIADAEQRMGVALQTFDTKWLGRGHQFLTGDKPTAADVVAACEIEQPRMGGYDSLEKYPNIKTWYSLVRNHFNPHYDDAHVILNELVEKFNKK